jgi:hypothetical protein
LHASLAFHQITETGPTITPFWGSISPALQVKDQNASVGHRGFVFWNQTLYYIIVFPLIPANARTFKNSNAKN